MNPMQFGKKPGGFARRWLGDWGSASGVTLIELLCVIAIIGILASLMLAPMGKALRKARGVAGLGEAADSTAPILTEIQEKYSTYRMANPNHEKLDLNHFIRACGLGSKADVWLHLSSVTFEPFSGSTPPLTIVIQSVAGPATGAGITLRVMDLLVTQ